MSKPILFYDIPGNVKYKCWSPNTWKTRYALNFKGLAYKTVWVEYPDIKSVCKGIGAEPTVYHDDGNHYYSLPVIQDPNTNAVISDSYRIAEYLEKTYPDSPKLFPTGSEGLQAAFDYAYTGTTAPRVPLLILKLSHSILSPRSQEYFRATREKKFGKPIEAFDEGATKQWGEFKAAISKVASWYDRNGGHFIQGDSLTYGDMDVAGYFAWYGYLTNKDSEEWRTMLTWDNGKWAKLMEALKPYEIVDE